MPRSWSRLQRSSTSPPILTGVIKDRGGRILPQITDVIPGQEAIDRTFISTWEDSEVVDIEKATGRKQLIAAGLWTETCVAMPAIQAAGEGWDATVITDASGQPPSKLAKRNRVPVGADPAGRTQRCDRVPAAAR